MTHPAGATVANVGALNSGAGMMKVEKAIGKPLPPRNTGPSTPVVDRRLPPLRPAP